MQKKMRRVVNSVPVASAPIRKPVVLRVEKIKNGVVIRFREYLAPIVNTSITSFTCRTYRVHPTNPLIFSFLKNIAPSFDEYHFEYMNIGYIASCPSTTVGEITMMYDPDINDLAPTTAEAMLNSQFSSDFAVWRSCGTDFPEHVIKVPGSALNITAPNKNITNYMQGGVITSSGTLFIGTVSSAPVGTVFGRVSVEYSVRLMNFNIPTVAPTPGSTVAVSTFSPYNCPENGFPAALGSPFGTVALYNRFPGTNSINNGVPNNTNQYGSMNSQNVSLPNNKKVPRGINFSAHTVATQLNKIALFDQGVHNLRIRFYTNGNLTTTTMNAAIAAAGGFNGVIYASFGVNLVSLAPFACCAQGWNAPQVLELIIVCSVSQFNTSLYTLFPSLAQADDNAIYDVPCSYVELNVGPLIDALAGPGKLISWYTIDYWCDVGDTFGFV